MIPMTQYEAHATRCVDPSITPQQRYEYIKQMKASLEAIQPIQFTVYMRAFMPVISKVLMELTRVQLFRNIENKTRMLALEVLSRFVQNDALKQWLREVMGMAFTVLRTDNEECALLAAHIILDLHKAYRPQLEAFVQPYVDIVKHLYEVYDETVKFNFPQDAVAPDRNTETVKPALHSFKVLWECPLVVMFLFQLYPKTKPTNLPMLLPLMIKTLENKPPAGASPVGRVYTDYVHSQVKTVYFLSFYLRDNLLQQTIKPTTPEQLELPKKIIRLLLCTPGDAMDVRKDLLMAMRIILQSQHRSYLFPYIDKLLDIKNMIGTTRGATNTLRPLALTILAELIQFIREQLSLTQLSRIIYLYSVNAHDPNFSYSMHASSIRLMLGLIEPILKHRKQAVPARALFIRLLYTLVTKFNSVASQASSIVDATNKKLKALPKPSSETEHTLLSSIPVGDPYRQQLEARHLVRTLLIGLKTVVWAAMNIGGHVRSGVVRTGTQGNATAAGVSGVPASSAQLHRGLTESECEMLTTILPGILECVKLCSGDNPADVKEMLDTFAQVFAVLDPRSFQDTFGFRMPYLFDIIMKNPSALAIPQHFLGNINISKYFADILLSFLVTRMKEGGEKGQAYASTLSQLSKILFYSVSHFPDNEPVLRPHLGRIVRDCLQYASDSKDPTFHLQLLWNLFKALRTGRFELQFDLLYREFMPLTEMLFQGLTRLYDGPHRAVHGNRLLELCLIIPARPSTTFPHLTLQMKPILLSIESGVPELVRLGLRTLEFWIDTLHPTYFHLLLDRVEPSLSHALHQHLKPAPYPFGENALRILGKLGARSRKERMLKVEHTPDYDVNDSIVLSFKWESGYDFVLPIDKICRLAMDAILDERPFGQRRADATYKSHCWRLLRASVLSVLDIPPNLDFKDLELGLFAPKSASKTRARYRAEREHVVKIISALVSCTLNEDIPGAYDFARGLSHWFGVLMARQKRPTREQELTLPGEAFAVALVRVMSRENRLHAKSAVTCLGFYIESVVKYSSMLEKYTSAKSGVARGQEQAGDNKKATISGTNTPPTTTKNDNMDEQQDRNGQMIPGFNTSESVSPVVPPALSNLVEQLCHCCYQRRWHQKWAGASGLADLINRVPADVFRIRSAGSYEAYVVKALMFLVRDLPGSESIETRDIARDALEKLFELCHQDKSVDQTRAVKDVTICLTLELAGRGAQAREVAKHAITKLSDIIKVDISELLKAAEDQLLRPLRRPLRQSPYSHQSGCIDALTFAMELEKPLLIRRMFAAPLREHCLKPIIEICEDPSFIKLTEAGGTMKHKLIDNKLIKNEIVDELLELRGCAVTFLCVLVGRGPAELRDASNEKYFTRIVSCFFKNIQSRDNIIMQRAMKGLKHAVDNYEISTSLLQTNLRPILSTLGDYKKLTLPYLESLSRVLQILSNWFNLNLGDRLLELLSNWTDPQQLTATKMWSPGTESRVGAAIIELFHLLPPRRGGPKTPRAASKFLPKLVDLVLKLEAVPVVASPGTAHLGLKGIEAASTSPYREPLLKYCNKHPSETVKHFLTQLHRKEVFQLFLVLLRADDGGPLREAVVEESQLLLSATFGAQNSDGSRTCQGAAVIDAVTERSSEWLLTHPEIVNALLNTWNSEKRSKMLENEEFIPVDQLSMSRRLAQILIRLCRRKNDESRVLFALLKAFMVRSLTDFGFVRDFFETEVTCYSLLNKRKIVSAFLDMFKDPTVSSEHKMLALKLLVIPVTEKGFEEHIRETSANFQENSPCSHTAGDQRTLKESGSGGAKGIDKVQTALKAQNQTSRMPTAESIVPVVPSSQNRTLDNETSLQAQSVNVQQGDTTAEQSASLFAVSVFDTGLLRRLNTEIFEQPDDVLRTYDEPLFAELLRLSTILIQYIPAEIGKYRRELIRFGWYHLKHDESIARQWAFINISRFFNAYQAPHKIVLQVYCNLLRDSKQNHKRSFQRALDSITPALPKRLEHNPAEHKHPLWVRYTRKAIVEECNSIFQLMHILHVIVRHQRLFYEARSQFVPIMVSSLVRGLSDNITPETRRITVDLAGLVLSWEQTGREQAAVSSAQRRPEQVTESVAGRKRELNPLQPPAKLQRGQEGQPLIVVPEHKPLLALSSAAMYLPSEVDSEDHRLTVDLVDKVFSFLTQLPFRIPDQRETRLVSDRCVQLLQRALELFPSTRVRMDHIPRYFERAITDKDVLAAVSGTASAKQRAQKAVDAVSANPNDPKAQNQAALAKIELNKAEKAERGAREKAAIRATLLVTSLEMGIILAKTQKQFLVTQNSTFIMSLVEQVIFSKSRNAAELFGKMLFEITSNDKKMSGGDEERMHSVLREICKTVGAAMERSLTSSDPMDTRCSLLVVNSMFSESNDDNLRVEMIRQRQEPLVKSYQQLSKEVNNYRSFGEKENNDKQKSKEAESAKRKEILNGQNMILFIRILGSCVNVLGVAHRKCFLQVLLTLCDRCRLPNILLEIVRLVGAWLDDPHRYDLNLKEQVGLLMRMVAFERIVGPGSDELKAAYFTLTLKIFGEGRNGRRLDVSAKLEKSFMIGLRAPDAEVRTKFFKMFDATVRREPALRLSYILSKQEWDSLADGFWIKQALQLLLAVIDRSTPVAMADSRAKFASLVSSSKTERELLSAKLCREIRVDDCLTMFVNGLREVDVGYLLDALDGLVYYDSSVAHVAWVSIVPVIWSCLKPAERTALDSAFSSLLVKEHLSTQMNVRRNIVQPLVESAALCNPPVPLKPELLLHLGSRWNAWHLVLASLDRRAEILTDELHQEVRSSTPHTKAQKKAELDAILNATAEVFRSLNEKDYFVSTWKSRSVVPATSRGLTYEQHGDWISAQKAYSSAMIDFHGSAAHSVLNISEGSSGLLENAEVALWQDRWIHCARELCQWDVLTEFSRSVVQTELMHDCFWRTANWGAFKELLLQHPIEDGPQLKIYQAYLAIQESKLDSAESALKSGAQRALDQYNALPVDSTLSCIIPTLVQFQQLVEVEESIKIMKEFHAMTSRPSGNTVPNISASLSHPMEHRIDNIRISLNTWRERIPTRYEVPSVWSTLLKWRNHIHQVIANTLTAYKDSQVPGFQKPNSFSKQALVMGINETAWNVHRFSRACRHQALPDVSIAALNKLYPFVTMELTEYFIKIKETAKAYLIGRHAHKGSLFSEDFSENAGACVSKPLGLDQQMVNYLQVGLDLLNASNLEHFSPRQKAQLFTIKGRFFDGLERHGDASKAYTTALGAAQDVGSAWFHYGIHCDKISRTDKSNPLLWREAATNCYIQAIRFGSRKARAYAARLLRLLTIDVMELPRKAEAMSETPQDGVAKMLMTHGAELPPWIWLPWLGQIIPMLSRPETLAAREILMKVAQTYPQSLYFGLRAFMEERVPIDRPSRNFASDASKMQRPTTQPLLPAAVAQQVAASTKNVSQAQAALLAQKTKLSAAHENMKAVQQAARDAGCTAQNASAPQFATFMAKQKQAQEEYEKEKKEYDKCIQSLRHAEHQKANVQALIGSANSANAKNDAHLRQVAHQARTPFEHADVVMATLVKSHQGLYFEMKRTAQEIATRMKPQQEEQFLGLMNGLLHRCFQSSVYADQDIDPNLRNALEDVSKMCFGTKGSDGAAPSVVKIPESVRDLKEPFEAELAPQTATDFPTKMEPFIKRLRKWKALFQRRVDAMPETMRLELMSPNLMELRSKDVEVFGQYLMAEADEPTLDSHVKIVSFSADVRIIRRVLGASRGITILGDDGRNHDFLLETSVNANYQRNEERVAHIFRLFNASIFAKDAEASRRGIKLEVPILIPTGHNTRLVSFDPTISCLAEGLERYVESVGGNFDDPLMAFRRITASVYATRRRARTTAQYSQEDSIAAKLQAYKEVCDKFTPRTCLSSWIQSAVPSADKRFGFIKRFAETLGTSSLVGYALSVGARRPQNIYFSWATGEVHTAHNRIIISPRGLLECDEKVPFRFTRNIQALIGRYGKFGPFLGSMAAALKAIRGSEDLLIIYLSLVVRDEIAPWVPSKVKTAARGGDGVAGKDSEFKYLEEKLRESIRCVMTRLNAGKGQDRDDDAVGRIVNFLIRQAENPSHLGQMDPRWQAWF